MQVDLLQVVTRDAKLAWDGSPTLRAEFGDNEAAYLAYCRADARGATRSLSPTVVSFDASEQPAPERFTLEPIVFDAAATLRLSAAARGHITGYAAKFGTVNRKAVRIMPGAFRNAVNKVPLPMLWGHDSDKPIGSWTALREDHYGLLATGQINLSVAAGRDAYALLERRDVTGLSVGINAAPGGSSRVDGVLNLTEVDLLEISIAPIPAEQLARVIKVSGDA